MKRFLILVLSAATIAFGGLEQVQNYGLPAAIAVVKSDTTVYSPPLRALFFSATAGQTITVDMASDGTNILFTYGAAGTYLLPVSVVKVWSTGTNVTGIVGLREFTGGPTKPTPTPSATATASSTVTPTPSATATPTTSP